MKEKLIEILGHGMERERAECKAEEVMDLIRREGMIHTAEITEEHIKKWFQQIIGAGSIQTWKYELNQMVGHRNIRMRIAYIAHPLSGNVGANLKRIAEIVRKINLDERMVVPFVPYYVDCHALLDTVPEERARGIANDIALFQRGFIDELRLYGDKISNGMWSEIRLARELGIIIKPMTKETTKALINNPLF